EVISLQDPGNRDRTREPDDLRVGELAQPFAVEADLRSFAVQHSERLLCELGRVRIQDVAWQHGTLVRATRGIADSGGVVADDKHNRVPFALELRETVEHVRKAEMNVGCGGIDAELHAERPAELEL